MDVELEKLRQGRMKKMLEQKLAEEDSIPEGSVHDLSDDLFEAFIQDNKLAVVDFWAPWCGPCRMMGPVFDELAKEFSGKVAFGKMNVDQEHAIAEKHSIRSIPTLLVFKDGLLVETLVGAHSKDDLSAVLRKILEEKE